MPTSGTQQGHKEGGLPAEITGALITAGVTVLVAVPAFVVCWRQRNQHHGNGGAPMRSVPVETTGRERRHSHSEARLHTHQTPETGGA